MLNRLILLVLTCGLLFLAFSRLSDQPQEKITLLDLLPLETAVVIESTDIAAAYREIRQGLAGKIISRKDFPTLLNRLPLSPEQQSQLVSVSQAFLGLQSHDNLLKIVPPHSIVALLPVEPDEQISLDQLGSRLVFIGHYPQKSDPLDGFVQAFGPATKEEHHEFQGIMLTSLSFKEGRSLSYFTYMGVLAWAFDERVLHPCVYQLLQDLIPIRAGVTKYKGYLQLKKLVARKTDTFVYLRMQALQELFACFAAKQHDHDFPCPQELALYSSSTKKGRRFSLVALADPKNIAAFKKRNRLADAVANAPIGRLTDNTTFALWTNWFKPHSAWEHLRQVDFAPIQYFLTWWTRDLRRLSGISVDEFLHLFGSDFSLYIDQLQSRGQHPRSLVASSMEIEDRRQVSEVLSKLTSKLRTESLLSGGLQIVQFMMAEGLLKPAYALGKHRLFLADSAELIERMHDKMSLASQHGGPSRGFHGQRSNFFLFLRTGDMVEWVLPVVETIRRDFGRHHGTNFEDWMLFQPLVQAMLQELKAIETTRVRCFLGEKELFLELGYTPK